MILALAGSASATEALVLTPEGRVLISHRFEPGLHLREMSVTHVNSCLTNYAMTLADALGYSRSSLLQKISTVSLAISGTDHTFPNFMLLGQLKHIGFTSLDANGFFVHGIAEAYHRAILGAGAGAVLRAGGGFSVFASNKNGDSMLASAYTTIMGAQGSSYTVGLRLFHIVKEVLDEVASKDDRALAAAVLQRAGFESPVEFLEVLDLQRLESSLKVMAALSALSAVVEDQSKAGNREADSILATVSKYQFRTVRRMFRRLRTGRCVTYPLYLAGGLFNQCPSMVDRLQIRLRASRQLSNVKLLVVGPEVRPVVGAAKLAFAPRLGAYCEDRRASGIDTSVAVCRLIEERQ